MNPTVKVYVRVRFRDRPTTYYLRIKKSEVDRLGWQQATDNKRPIALRLSPDLVVRGLLSFDGAGRSGWISCQDYNELYQRLQAGGFFEGSEIVAEILPD